LQRLSLYELNLRARKRKIKNISLITSLVLIILIFLFLFSSIYPANKQENFAFATAEKKFKMFNPTTFKLSTRDKEPYYSVIGQINEKNTLLIFNKSGSHVLKIAKNKLIAPTKIKQILIAKNYKEILTINPSIYKKVGVYEISFLDKKDNIGFLTIDIKNGDIYRAITGI
jgi:uncharacterized protein YpmB